MKKKDASFWSDIKALDERLMREPDSFCFARLSEIYLKVGLMADALHTARSGVAKHPGYLAGQRALAMACNASGLHDECRVILEQVTAATPEDVDTQKMLASLYVAAGDNASAIRTYRTVLDFRPDDAASAVELEALQHGSTTCSSVYSTSGQIDTESDSIDEDSGEDEIIDLSESDIFEEPFEEEMNVVTPPDALWVTPDHHDPLSTLTLAELYEKQGFLVKAREIYQTILAEDPTNAQLLAKIAQLEVHEPVPEDIPEDAVAAGFDEEPDFYEPVVYEDVPAPLESQLFAPLAHKAADKVLDTLGDWLENIRRIKACR
jgi:tetratricopeptide (TPR) repeat protein